MDKEEKESLEIMLEQLLGYKLKLEEELSNVKDSIENIESQLKEVTSN